MHFLEIGLDDPTPTVGFGLDLNMEVALSYGPNPLQLIHTLNDK